MLQFAEQRPNMSKKELSLSEIISRISAAHVSKMSSPTRKKDFNLTISSEAFGSKEINGLTVTSHEYGEYDENLGRVSPFGDAINREWIFGNDGVLQSVRIQKYQDTFFENPDLEVRIKRIHNKLKKIAPQNQD